MGKNLGEDRKDSETKNCQHLGRGKKLRASNFPGGTAEIHRCLFVKGRKEPVSEGEEGRRRDHNTRWKKMWPSTKDLNVEGRMDKM